MDSDSPGGPYSRSHHGGDNHDCHVLSGLLPDANGTRGNFQMGVVGGFQRDAPYVIKDSGYYVSTSDGASTCSSSTTEAGENEGGTLLVLEPKSLRSFNTNDEYLYAMKEDLADWFACLYQRDDLTAENFFHILETGVLLCKHANKVQEFARQRREMGEALEMRSYFIRSVPEGNLSYREGVKPETFQARDNVSNFICWGRQLGIPEVLSFETDDLVLRKNEKSVILCLLEIARVGAKLGMLAPTLIQMEQEIDAELAGEEPKPHIQIITCDMRSLEERVRDLIGRCTCPIQFPMIKVGEGKYKIGDSRSLIFVRILRNHVMVRVGGGWDTLENYLNKHDPCQCNYRGHRPSGAGVAHKVVVSQQRPPAAPSIPASRPASNTPTSPRRGSTAAASGPRSVSPHSSSKTQTLVISRHLPVTSKRAPSPDNHAKVGLGTPSSSKQGEAIPHPSGHTAGHKTPSPARPRSPSPRTKIQGLPQPGHLTSSSSAQARGKEPGRQNKTQTPRKDRTETLASDNDDEDITNSDGYFTEDEGCNHQRSQAKTGSASFDQSANLHLRPSNLEQGRESDTADGTGKTSVSMDKISTMTLSEFKSLLSSALSVPEEQKHGGHIDHLDGGLPEQAHGPASISTRHPNWNTQNERASLHDSTVSEVCARRATGGVGSGAERIVGMRSLPESPDADNEESPFGNNRVKTPKVSRKSIDMPTAADTGRPRMLKSNSTSKTAKVSGDLERVTSHEEYQMARPKPASQIKRDAVAKVAGAISNWVESRQEVHSTAAVTSRPKTPTRPKTLLGSHSSMSMSQSLLQENAEGDNSELVGTSANSLMQALSIAGRERPVTPSRIPKPFLTPRPKTPVSLMADSPSDVPSQLCLLSQQCSHSNLSRISIVQSNRPTALSRSNSNSSSVKSVDEAPVSPASSLSDDRVFKIHTRTRRLSNSSDNFNTNNINVIANNNSNNTGRSYKDIYTAKRAATSGPDGRILPTRAVTPGPREKWTLGGSTGCSSVSENTSSAPNIQRRRSINATGHVDKQTISKASTTMSQIGRTSSPSNIETEQQMAITNEITFSDDEEINELVKNAALKARAHSVRSSSVDARKHFHQNMKDNEDVLMIRRDQQMKGNVSCDTHFSIVRRPASRGSSMDRASPATVASRMHQASNSSMHVQRMIPEGKIKEPDETSQAGVKGLNRTEAWVDSTLPDNKKKPLHRPKRAKGTMNEISVSELASRPLEEIQAILTEPKNGCVHVDFRALEAPSEDPEMFRKMEKLFEKYREMELKASIKKTPDKGGDRLISMNKLSDSQSAKGGSHGSSHGVSKSSTSMVSLKKSGAAFVSPSCHSSGHTNAAPGSSRLSSNEDSTFTRSSSTPGPFQNHQHRSSNNSPAFAVSFSETEDYISLEPTNHTETMPYNCKISGPECDHRGLAVLQDIDPEVVKNPAALISKIKEILKVRPRKDENTKVPTRIPAPAVLNKYNRSRSVTNLYGDMVSNTNGDFSHDCNPSNPDSKGVLLNTNSSSFYDDHNNSVQSYRTSSSLSTGKNASSDFDNADDPADEVPALTQTWSAQSDSGDSQNRTETPVPKVATPLTTGRSTLICRKGDKFARSLSQDKENLSSSQSTISVLSPTEDEAEFV